MTKELKTKIAEIIKSAVHKFDVAQKMLKPEVDDDFTVDYTDDVNAILELLGKAMDIDSAEILNKYYGSYPDDSVEAKNLIDLVDFVKQTISPKPTEKCPACNDTGFVMRTAYHVEYRIACLTCGEDNFWNLGDSWIKSKMKENCSACQSKKGERE